MCFYFIIIHLDQTNLGIRDETTNILQMLPRVISSHLSQCGWSCYIAYMIVKGMSIMNHILKPLKSYFNVFIFFSLYIKLKNRLVTFCIEN